MERDAVTEIGDDEFDLDVLMRRIRSDVEKRRATAGAVAAQAGFAFSPAAAPRGAGAILSPELKLGRFEEAAPPFEYKDRYPVEEFLRYHDEQFVRNAYRGILRREPDGTGLASFLDPLRHDKISKIEVLGRIRYSPEGRTARTRIDGLATRFAARSARRIPVVGRVIGILQYIARLPELAESLDRFERAYFQRDPQTRRQLDANNALVEHTLAALDRRATDRLERVQDDVARLESRIQVTEIERRASEEALASLSEALAVKADFADLQQLSADLARKADVQPGPALDRANRKFRPRCCARAG